MPRECNVRKSREADNVQDDRNERKNLSRLIHTVQHIPSSRYRLSADTLWGLVNELESFQPPDSKEPVYSHHRPARKSFSRKYLNLRLYPATDRSSSPESILKSQREEKTPEAVPDIKSNKNKKFGTQKDETEAIKFEHLYSKKCQKRRYLCKSNTDLGKGRKENTNERNVKSVSKSSPIPKASKSKYQTKPSSFQDKPKAEEKGTSNKMNCYDQSYGDHVDRCLDQETSSVFDGKRNKCKILNKAKNFRHFNSNKPKSRSPSIVGREITRAVSKDHLLAKDQASMVKKLTNYWNNLLNSEVEDSNSISGSSQVPHINKSLQDLARKIYHTVGNRQSGTKLISRHRSESSVDTLRELDSCLSVCDFQEHFDAMKDLNEERLAKIKLDHLNVQYEPLEYSKGYLFNDVHRSLTKSCLLDCDFKNTSANYKRSLQVIKENEPQVESLESNFNLKSQNAIEVMEKMICKLKLFKDLPLTSSEITLSHSLRTMLCLMTATVISSKEDIFHDCYYYRTVEEADTCFKESPSMNQPTVASDNDSISRELSIIPHSSLLFMETENNISYSQTIETSKNNQLVPAQGITMRQVEDAIRYMNICKDYLWSEFILNSTYKIGSSYYENTEGTYPGSFTFVFEEEIVIDGSYEEDDSCYGDEPENEDGHSSTAATYRSAVDCVLIGIEELINLIIDLVLLYRPNSIQEFIKALYQVLVSVLVWWVITKEIFGK